MLESTLSPASRHAERVTAAERRVHARYYFARPPLIPILLPPALSGGVALLSDLSAGGMGLIVAYRIDPGATLFAQLWGSRPATRRTHVARVMHATPQPDGTWLIGCRFTPPLSDRERARAVEQDR